MTILRGPLTKVSGNLLIQNLLEKNVPILQSFMGIGTASSVKSSGEQAIFHVLKQKKQPPYCIFDVGSNQGQFLQLILENVATNEFQIHCFEPAHETFKMLVESSKEDERIKLNNIGLGKERGDAVLYYDSFGSVHGSLSERWVKYTKIEDFKKSDNVVIDTIDNYCSENMIDHIHLLKIDIEGHELDALAGAKRMFSTKSIDIVSFEFGACHIITRTFFQDFWYFFSEANYKLFRLTPSGYLYPLESYKSTLEQFRTTIFIAVADG